MLLNYLKISLRRLSHYKIYSLINVLGLSLGLCCCLIIWLIVQYELSFDKFQMDRNSIYQVNTISRLTADDPFTTVPAVLPPLPEEIRRFVPGIEVTAPYHILFNANVRIENSGHLPATIPTTPIFAGPQYLAIMNYEWLQGNIRSSLAEPFSVVLTLKKGQSYFGAISPEEMMGKPLLYNDSIPVRVTGIVKDLSANTDFPYDEFISMPTTRQRYVAETLHLEQWKGLSESTRVLLKLNRASDPAAVNASIRDLFKKNWANKLIRDVTLEPLSAIHFSGHGGQATSQVSRLPVLYALTGIALFILALAVINYVNLATAQAISRAKETAIRKIVGGSRTKLFLQLLSETLLLTLIAAIVATLLVQPALSAFHEYLPAQIKFDPLNPRVLMFLFAIVVTTTLLAGIYPASMLSSLSPISRLSGHDSKWLDRGMLRKILIVFQFTVSLIFITCTLLISKQIKFMTGQDTGFRANAILLLPSNASSDLDKAKRLQQQIARLPAIMAVARENLPPTGVDHAFFTVKYAPKSGDDIPVAAIKTDENFIPLYNIKLLAGRNLFPSDTIRELVINESLSKLLGFAKPSDAIGKMLLTWNKNCPIVGVVADFHQFSFHEPIKPQVITAFRCTEITIKLNISNQSARNIKEVIASIEKESKAIYPDEPFEYEFLDEQIADLYKKELATSWLMQIATSMTIIISCIGLLGLTMFTVEKKAKEIGIRKVLGASVGTIIATLTGGFLLLITIAFVTATPIAIWISHDWLQDFAYRTRMSWYIFALAGLSAMGIALITIGWQALKAATVNPAKILRSE